MESDASSSGGEVRRKPSQRMDDGSSLGTYSKYQEYSRRMEDVGQRGRSSRIPGVGYRKGDYSLRMESGVRR